MDRDDLGRLVHEERARQLFVDTGVVLGSWEDTAESVREGDRQVGEVIARAVLLNPTVSSAGMIIPPLSDLSVEQRVATLRLWQILGAEA